jgi:Protein of unknown function (DUF2911)
MGKILLCLACLLPMSAAAQPAPDAGATTACTFDDGKQISVQYQRPPGKSREPSNGRIWMPGNAPVTLFTQAELTINQTAVPVGAYSVYIIPGKEAWTFILSKNVTSPSKYDKDKDVLRAPMQTGVLGTAVNPPEFAFSHAGPKQCNLRLYAGETGSFLDISER